MEKEFYAYTKHGHKVSTIPIVAECTVDALVVAKEHHGEIVHSIREAPKE